MANYNLQSNEFMILRTEELSRPGSNSNNYELILTNINIVFITGRGSRNGQTTKIFPLSQIKLFNGNPQVLINIQSGYPERVDIYFTNGQESFQFYSKKEANRWAESIKQVLTGTLPEGTTNKLMAIPGTEIVAATLKDTFDTVKDVFGVKSKGSNNMQNVMVTIKCVGCGASLAGIQGRRIKCKYCDTDQSL